MLILKIIKSDFRNEQQPIFDIYRFGRKKWCILGYLFTGVCGIANGVLQQIGNKTLTVPTV